MKIRRQFLFCLAALLCLSTLSGCSALLERTHLDVRPHQVAPPPTLGPGDYITVSSQEELERAIWDMVLGRQESGLFRVQHFRADGMEIVDAAVREAWQRPLVAYAVSNFLPLILSDVQGIMEIELVVSYQKTAEQIAGVRSVNHAITATALLGQMLRNGETYLAMLSPAHIANVSFLESIIRDYYYSQALEVVVRPKPVINLYPSSGSGNLRIAEVALDFGVDQRTLAQMRGDLRLAATELIGEMPEALTSAGQIIWLAGALSDRVTPLFAEAPEADVEPEALYPIYNTAFGALVLGQASSEGIAMAFQALLQLLDLQAQVVRGELDDLPHAWNILAFKGHYYHIDVSMLHALGSAYALFVPDEIMMFQNGYSWDAVLYPRADSGLRYADFSE